MTVQETCCCLCFALLTLPVQKKVENNATRVSLVKVMSCYLDAYQPLLDSCECVFCCYIIHHNDTISFSEKLLGNASVPTSKNLFIALFNRSSNLTI